MAQLVLDDMRRNVRKALFIDELDTRPNARTPLSATEVSERLADVARDMGAVAGRMQKEFHSRSSSGSSISIRSKAS